MIAFIISRILQAIPVMLAVTLIAFSMFAYVGDPVTIMLGQDFTEAQRDALIREALVIYREDVPHIPLHHQMIPWAMRAGFAIPHAANNQPMFRFMVVN